MVRHFKRGFAALLCTLASITIFSSCGSSGQRPEPVETQPPEAEATSTPVPVVILDGTAFPADSIRLDFSDTEVPFSDLLANRAFFVDLKEMELGDPDCDYSQIQALCEAFQGVDITWRTSILGEEYDSKTTVIDLSRMTREDAPYVCSQLERLPLLEVIDLVPGEGMTTLPIEALEQLSQAVPHSEIRFCYELYGQTVSADTQELRYDKVQIGDSAIPEFRRILPFLNSLKLLRFCDCGIRDNDAMAELRNDFPGVNVVWSIEITGSLFMTDTTLMHDPLLRDKHVHLLQYFPDILYLDIGHNHYLTSVDFIKYLPKLQVAILAITHISDISALSNCPDLEYCELFNSHIADLSPLAGLQKLEYLNIGDMPFVEDISPIFGLRSLKMVRICGSTFNKVSREQVEELKERLPDCIVSDGGGDPTTSGGWRWDVNHVYTERYALLRKQMLYDIKDWKKRQSNSPSGEMPDP